MDIFGDGYDYDDGLADEDEVLQTPETEERRYQDVSVVGHRERSSRTYPCLAPRRSSLTPPRSPRAS